MIRLLLAALTQATPLVAPPPPAGQPSILQPPSSDTWDTLPALQLRRTGADTATLYRFVRAEVEAGRCAAAVTDGSGRVSLRAPVAVLVGADGSVRRMVPAAIGCPTVEQFTVGVIGRLAVGNVRAPWPGGDRWYRSGLTYIWTRDVAPGEPPAR